MPPLAPATNSTAWPQYFVLCDFGQNGRAWTETDPETADRETVRRWLAEGQFSHPVRVMEVDLPAGRCRDVTPEFLQDAKADAA